VYADVMNPHDIWVSQTGDGLGLDLESS
jgi:hypothetical protein